MRRQRVPSPAPAAASQLERCGGSAQGIHSGPSSLGRRFCRSLHSHPGVGGPSIRACGHHLGARALPGAQLEPDNSTVIPLLPDLQIAEMSYPTKVVFGVGALARLGAQAERLKIRRPLLVTDAGVVKAGLAQPSLAELPRPVLAFQA